MFLTKIRAAVIAKLTGLPLTGANVLEQQPYALQAESLPCIVVTAAAPAIIMQQMDQTVLEADVTVDVWAYARQNSNGTTTLDNIAAQVVVAMGVNLQVGATQPGRLPVELQSIEQPEFSGEGERVSMRRRISFSLSPVSVSATDLDTFV
jgi:hypothetical protein